jgi:catechol 2,3-dioxygenase-like lactoylglutathione lyase family enzyme
MSTIPTNLDAITLFVADRKRSKAFYESAFGLAPIYEDDNSVAFRFDNTIVNLLEGSAAHDLIAPAPVAGAGRGSTFQLTIGIEDTDAACAELASRGVDLLNGPVDRAWGLRTASFADPDGHIWEVAAQIAD